MANEPPPNVEKINYLEVLFTTGGTTEWKCSDVDTALRSQGEKSINWIYD